jgi:hypothetical protein
MDALHRLVVRGATTSPDAATPEPLVNIVMTKAEYEAELAAMMGGDRPSLPRSTTSTPSGARPPRGSR